jgi:hypothetical protein
MQEVVAAGGRIILVTDGRGQHRRILGDTVLCTVDQADNLANSVTVE